MFINVAQKFFVKVKKIVGPLVETKNTLPLSPAQPSNLKAK